MADKKDRKELLIHVYHASLPAEDREWVLNEYSSSSSIIRCLICSSAFGMGINIPDIQHVVLWGAPSTMSEIWQEIGRAGRDGSPCKAMMLFTPLSVTAQRTEQCVRDMCKPSVGCLRSFIINHIFYREVEVADNGESCLNQHITVPSGNIQDVRYIASPRMMCKLSHMLLQVDHCISYYWNKNEICPQ